VRGEEPNRDDGVLHITRPTTTLMHLRMRLNLCESSIIVSPCRPSVDRGMVGRHGVVGRNIRRTQIFVLKRNFAGYPVSLIREIAVRSNHLDQNAMTPANSPGAQP